MNSKKRQGLAFLLIGGLSIGFAYLSTSLNVLGTTTVSRASWDVHFENVQVSEGSVYAEEPEIDENETTVSYNVHLDLPGDFYEFTVDAVNDGTLDAMIETFTNTEISSRVLQYLSYSVTYLDGREIKQKDILEANDFVTYKIRVEYLKDIEASDLDENGVDLELTFGVEYVQSTTKITPFTKLVKDSAQSDSNINFGTISSASNGRGLYVMNSTTEDTYPIYYYRGNVNNNNAKFAGFCWKIVRTTETGGTKLIYNGVPDQNGYCTNTTGTSTQLSNTTKFNNNPTPLAYSGYMYGSVYQRNDTTTSSSHLYGNSFTYSNGVYTLKDTSSGANSTHHYTCFNNTGTCTNISYVYFIENSTKAYYIVLNNGENISEAIEKMNVNSTNSVIKTQVDNWFNNTFKVYFTNNNKNYNDYLEDTVWCNDRSIYSYGGWNPNGGSLTSNLEFSTYRRMLSGQPSLNCSKNDSFTVEERATGNGALTYPVGLLTMDEMNLAGGQTSNKGNNTDYYLYTNQMWWGISPWIYNGYLVYQSRLNSSGYVDADDGVFYSHGIRPSISIKPEVKIASGGDGTSTTPYEFVVE